MTRGRVRDMIRKRLGETTASFWTDAELNDWINDAGRDIAFKVKSNDVNGYLTTTSSMEYMISLTFPTLLSIKSVWMLQDGTTWRRLEQTERKYLSQTESTGWRSATAGVPQKYYWTVKEDLFGLYPKPDSNNQGTSYVRIYYARDYIEPANDDTELDVPTTLDLAVADFVVAVGYETRGWGDKANDAWRKYTSRLKGYHIIKDSEMEEDDDIVMVNYRNI